MVRHLLKIKVYRKLYPELLQVTVPSTGDWQNIGVQSFDWPQDWKEVLCKSTDHSWLRFFSCSTENTTQSFAGMRHGDKKSISFPHCPPSLPRLQLYENVKLNSSLPPSTQLSPSMISASLCCVGKEKKKIFLKFSCCCANLALKLSHFPILVWPGTSV